MSKRFALDDWVVIPIGDNKTLFGREVGTKNFRVTSDISKMDTGNPPRWALTISGSHYDLLNRAASISKYAYAGALDTLLQRGYSADDVAHFLCQAERIVKECNTDEVISMFLRA